MNLEEWSEAERDMQHLLKLEPRNKMAQELLSQARKKIGNAGSKKKGRRVQIEEVEDSTANNEASNTAPLPKADIPDSNARASNTTLPEAGITPPMPEAKRITPMPADVLKWKELGNDLFRRGQYGEAVVHYTKAIQKLETGL